MSPSFCTVGSSSTDRTAKLLFFNGSFERPNKSKHPSRRNSTHETHHNYDHYFSASARPSSSPEGRHSCSNLVHSAGEKLNHGRDHHRRAIQSESESESRSGSGSESSILHSFAVLAQGILSVWEGEESVRGRLDLLARRQQAMKGDIEMIEKTQSDLQERLRMLEEQAEEELAILEKIREDRISLLRASRSVITPSTIDPLRNDLVSTPRCYSWPQHSRGEEEDQVWFSFGREKLDGDNLSLKAHSQSYGKQKLDDRNNNPDSYRWLNLEEKYATDAVEEIPNHRENHSGQKLGEQYVAERGPNNTKLSFGVVNRLNFNSKTTYGFSDRSNTRNQQELQMAAFEMVELVHKKLTAHMWSQMLQKLKDMKSDRQRGEYLELLRGKGTPFAGKPLSEVTYAELLSFFISENEEGCTQNFYNVKDNKERIVGVRGEVIMPGEDAIVIAEAANRGYISSEETVGDSDGEAEANSPIQKERVRAGLREAMEAAELGFMEELKSKGYDSNAVNSIGVMEVRQQMEVYVRCHRQMKHLTGRHHQLKSDLLSKDTISHTIRTQKLGILQPASTLIELGCFLLSYGNPKP